MRPSTAAYTTEIGAWRQAAEAALRREWLGLVACVALQPGLNRIGTDPNAEILLPAGSAPEHVGVLNVVSDVVVLRVARGVTISVNGSPVTRPTRLRPAGDGPPDRVALASLTFALIQRGTDTLVHVYDANSPALETFGGRRWFPIDARYCVEGAFTPYRIPPPPGLPPLRDDVRAPVSPGAVTFTLGGQEHRLEATGWRAGGGRVVVTSPPVSGRVRIDFTAYAPCPEPPPPNRLSVRVEAGELLPHGPFARQREAGGSCSAAAPVSTIEDLENPMPVPDTSGYLPLGGTGVSERGDPCRPGALGRQQVRA